MLIHEFVAVERAELLERKDLVEKNELIQKNEPLEKHVYIEDVPYEFTKNRKCVRISDDLILQNHEKFFSSFKTNWGIIGNIHEGLNYYGITLILNEDLPQFISVLIEHKKRRDIKDLIKLCQTAIENNQDIVHFGI